MERTGQVSGSWIAKSKNSSAMRWVKRSSCGLIVLSMMIIGGASQGSDVIGGGSLSKIMKAFKEKPEVIEELKRQRNLRDAREVWLDSLSDQERDKVLGKVFQELIVPQVKSRRPLADEQVSLEAFHDEDTD